MEWVFKKWNKERKKERKKNKTKQNKTKKKTRKISSSFLFAARSFCSHTSSRRRHCHDWKGPTVLYATKSYFVANNPGDFYLGHFSIQCVNISSLNKGMCSRKGKKRTNTHTHTHTLTHTSRISFFFSFFFFLFFLLLHSFFFSRSLGDFTKRYPPTQPTTFQKLCISKINK